MESTANLDVLKGIGNVALNASTLSLPGMADYMPYFSYSNQAVGNIGEMYGLAGLSGLATSSPSGTVATGAAAGADSAANVVNGMRLNNQLAADEIANGHAFDKHVIEQNEFGSSITTQQQFANQIENIFNNPSAEKQLSNGRSAYWDDTSGMVVIRNPKAADGGTEFKPTNGKAYFNGLR